MVEFTNHAHTLLYFANTQNTEHFVVIAGFVFVAHTTQQNLIVYYFNVCSMCYFFFFNFISGNFLVRLCAIHNTKNAILRCCCLALYSLLLPKKNFFLCFWCVVFFSCWLCVLSNRTKVLMFAMMTSSL